MGLKKYEIITVGSNKRVRALRSWQVQDRYVNIGDVGGIVYDEKTLSQDGACWLFRGNFNFPGARIGGDSVVDMKEGGLPPRNYNVDILGSSVLVGGEVRFNSNVGATDNVTLAAADFEAGTISYMSGTNWETWKSASPNYLRTKAPIFMGGTATTLKLDVPGYTVQAYVLDRDGIGLTATASTNTGAGATLVVPAGQYMVIRLAKSPLASIALSDATTAQIKYTQVYESSLTVIDSRVEINPPTSNTYLTWVTAGVYAAAAGVSFPGTIIRGTTLKINRDGAVNTSFTTAANLINSMVTIDSTANPQVFGVYENVKNLVFSGSFSGISFSTTTPTLIQVYDCENMVVNAANFPGLAAIQTAGVPIRFYNCNLNNGRFYHHAQIANTYRGINFDLATKDLGKSNAAGHFLISSEVNGMYRLSNGTIITALVESHESVKSIGSSMSDAYNTTIYADAYLNGKFDLRGTNVFGNAMKHGASNTQNVMAVQGGFTFTAGLPPVPSTDNTRVRTVEPVRINGSKGLSVQSIPAGVEGRIVYLDAAGNYKALGGWYTGNNVAVPDIQLVNTYMYLLFRKPGDTAITPDDVKGVTVTTYNGCKLVNTKETGAVIAGNVRVEDNATLIDTSVTGTGYFGGNSIAQGLAVEGLVYMKDNAVFAPTITGTPKANVLRMTDNASFTGVWSGTGTNLKMSDNARYGSPTAYDTAGSVEMSGNVNILGSGTVKSFGILVLKDDAYITGGAVTAYGDITIDGKFIQANAKSWTGKRVISDWNAPTYDNNVKTKYDF